MNPMDEELNVDQANLMLYLAGELPADQRAALEARLSREPELQAALQSLKALQEGTGAHLASLDARDGALVSDATATGASRAVGRAVGQWHARRVLTGGGFRLRRWAYAAAAVVLIGIGFFAWHSRQTQNGQMATNTPATQPAGGVRVIPRTAYATVDENLLNHWADSLDKQESQTVAYSQNSDSDLFLTDDSNK